MYNDENNLNNNMQPEINNMQPEINNEQMNTIDQNNNMNTVNNDQTFSNDYQYQNNTDQNFQYPVYNDTTNNSSSNDYESDDDSNSKKRILLILLIIGIVLALFGFGYFIYSKVFSNSNKNKTNLDSITVENGVLSPQFSLDNVTYTVETTSSNIKFLCKYKNKDVDIEGCNKEIVLNENETNQHKIKFNNKEYVFLIVKINEEAPVIDEVIGNSKEWTKSITLTVNASFELEENENSYSFDAGKTWQKENKKAFTKNDTISIMVRDKAENLSTIYTEKIDKIDRTAPSISATSTTGNVVALTIKDNDSGIVAWTVTRNTNNPSSWTKIDLSNNIVVKYNATTTGTFYGWAKDKVGNVTYKKFVIGKENTEPDDPTPPTKKENVTISGVSGNSDEWTQAVTLKVNAKSNYSNANLVYSFDGGKTYQNSNTKKFTTNGTISIVVKNNKTGMTSSKNFQTIKYVDAVAPSCGTVTGGSTSWVNTSRTIKVACTDKGGSGCKETTIEKKYLNTKKTDSIAITDNAGNKTTCSVNVYVDTTGPKLIVKPFTNEKGKIYKFQLFAEDNDSGVSIDSVKYKEKLLKNGIDNIWHKNWNASQEISKSGDIYTAYRFTKENGLYKYFTISATDNLGNLTEINYTISE